MALCREIVDERALRAALIEELAAGIGFAFYAWLLTDPVTEVGAAPLALAPSVADLPRLIRAKYLTPVNRWTTLDPAVATLRGTTSNHPGQSLLWREVLAGYGVGDVASVVFRDQHGCWGWLDLWRRNDDPPFAPAEVARLMAVVAPVTEALRLGQARTFNDQARVAAPAGPFVLILSPTLEVTAATPDTSTYLRAMVPPEAGRDPIPAAAYNVGAQLLAVEAGVDEHPPMARVHVAGAGWVTLRAARVRGAASPGGPDIAVTIEPSTPAERRDLFARAHGLTPREAELMEHLAGGADTRTVAKLLFVSEYTVQDHLKSIFAKTGTRSRRTLLSRVSGA